MITCRADSDMSIRANNSSTTHPSTTHLCVVVHKPLHFLSSLMHHTIRHQRGVYCARNMMHPAASYATLQCNNGMLYSSFMSSNLEDMTLAESIGCIVHLVCP